MAKGDPKVQILLRVGPGLKQRIWEYAARTGISANAAAATLIDAGLESTGTEQESES